MNNRIKGFAEDSGLTFSGVARVLGVSKSTISRMTNDPDYSAARAELVQGRLDRIYAENKISHVFRSIHGLSQEEKVDALLGVLYQSTASN